MFASKYKPLPHAGSKLGVNLASKKLISFFKANIINFFHIHFYSQKAPGVTH